MFPLYLLLLFAFGLLQRLIMSLLFLGEITLVSIGQQGRGEGIFNSANEKGKHNWLHLSPVEGLSCFHVFQEVLFWPHAKQLPFNTKFTLEEKMKLQESDQQAQKSAKILLVARNSMCSEQVHTFRVVCADSSPKKASGCFSGACCWQSDTEGHIRSVQWKSVSNMKVGDTEGDVCSGCYRQSGEVVRAPYPGGFLKPTAEHSQTQIRCGFLTGGAAYWNKNKKKTLKNILILWNTSAQNSMDWLRLWSAAPHQHWACLGLTNDFHTWVSWLCGFCPVCAENP